MFELKEQFNFENILNKVGSLKVIVKKVKADEVRNIENAVVQDSNLFGILNQNLDKNEPIP